MPSDDLIPVMIPRDGVALLASNPRELNAWQIAKIEQAARQALETPPQPDPSKLILEYVEAKRERLIAIATGTKPSSREGEALRALMDFADGRKI